MAWKDIVGQNFSPKDFKNYVAELNWFGWQPDLVVLHNTGVGNKAERK